MHPYLSQFTDGPNSAVDDLKGMDRAVREQVLDFVETELMYPPAERSDGGVYPGGVWCWLRCATLEDRRRQAQMPMGKLRIDASDYIVIYRPFTAPEVHHHRESGFHIQRILSNSDLAPWIAIRFGPLGWGAVAHMPALPR